MGKGGNPIKQAFNITPAGMIVDELGRPGREAAAAAQAAAMAQQGEARRQRTEARGMTEGVTLEALMSYDRALQTQDRNLSRQEQLISQIDPTILEASQQALRLLRGETSSTLAPLQKQRDMQRQKLLNQLREQLGPGAETSTAGMQALNRFDSETSNLFAGAQQQALGNLGAIAGQFNSVRPDMLREASGFGALATNRQGLRLNQLAAMNPSNQAVFGTAGAQYTGDLIKAQSQQGLYNQLMGAGVTAGTAYLTGGASLAKPGQQQSFGAQAGGSYLPTGNIA